MINDFAISYFDRASGSLKPEKIFARRFLRWSYNTTAGRLLTNLILSRRVVSELYGWLARRSFSRMLTAFFVRKMGVDQTELPRLPEDFANFNSFFKREIDMSSRPVDRRAGILTSPADGKLLVVPSVAPDISFRIKRNVFNLRRFVRDDAITERFAGGPMVVIRLALSDYHHFHFPDSGTPFEPAAIGGRYLAGGSYDLTGVVPFYTENARTLTLFDSDHFGPVLIAEVGAFTVGSIKQTFLPRYRVSKGERKGFFELGGSTVVLLFQRGKVTFDRDLLENSRLGLETSIRTGESIGREATR